MCTFQCQPAGFIVQSDREFLHHPPTDGAEQRFPRHRTSTGKSNFLQILLLLTGKLCFVKLLKNVPRKSHMLVRK